MFNFKDLDDKTRKYMLEAIEEAEETEQIYYSTRFNNKGEKRWLSLLKKAAKKHNEHWLAYQIEAKGLMKEFENAKKPSGEYTTKHVPHDASKIMAEGQFNRFYILGLCRRAQNENVDSLIVYRAKSVAQPRVKSQQLIGESFKIEEIENQLKTIADSFDSELVKPNSGLSLKLP